MNDLPTPVTANASMQSNVTQLHSALQAYQCTPWDGEGGYLVSSSLSEVSKIDGFMGPSSLSTVTFLTDSN